MKRRSLIKCFLAGFSLAAGRRSPASTRKLTVGIFPRRNVSVTYVIYNPLFRYLGEQLGIEIELVTSKDFPSFWDALKTERFDFVHCNQYQYILINQLYGYQAILRNEEFGESTIAGAVIVRNDSGIKQPTDLRGKVIMFGGDRLAMQSYISPTWLLRKAGLSEGDYEERFALNPPNAVISTFLRQADAAGSGDVVIRLDSVKHVIDVSQMRFLARTEPMAHLPWAVHPRVDSSVSDAFQRILIHLNEVPEGRSLLERARLTGLVASVDSDFDMHRAIARDVYGPDLGMERWK